MAQWWTVVMIPYAFFGSIIIGEEDVITGRERVLQPVARRGYAVLRCRGERVLARVDGARTSKAATYASRNDGQAAAFSPSIDISQVGLAGV